MDKGYHKMVWREAHKEAKNYVGTDRRLLAGNIVLAIASGFATTRLLDFWNKTIIIPSIVQIIAIVVGTLFGFVALYIFHLLLNGFWVIPARLFNEERLEARKRTWKDIDIVPYSFPMGSGFGIGLQITSDKPVRYDVELSKAEIIQIVHAGKTTRYGVAHGGVEVGLQLVYGRGEMFSIENKSELANRTYSHELSTFLVVAKVDDQKAYIEILNPNEGQVLVFVVDTLSPAWLTIELQSKLGVLEHIEMERCSIICKLSYDQVENKFLISNLTREPKYEK